MEKKKYPIPRVEGPNIEYAHLLEQDYVGPVSEETAIHLYLYQHMINEKMFPEFSDLLHHIMIDEMIHLELLGETILLLGGDPKYRTIESTTGIPQYWKANYVNYATGLKEMLAADIESEEIAIRNYEAHREMIQDRYIKELLTAIIENEKEHLHIFQTFFQNYILRSKRG